MYTTLCFLSFLHGCNQGGKCRDISAIYRQNIEYRSISTRYMLEKYRFHDILSIYREFHPFLIIYWHFIILSSIYCDNLGGQMRINAVKLLKMPQDFRRGGSNPSQKVWLATSQPLRQVCPLVYNGHQIYIKSNSSYKHNFFKNVLKNKLIIIIL